MHYKAAGHMLLIGRFLIDWLLRYITLCDFLETNCAQALCRVIIIRYIVILQGRSIAFF